jgi:hypothetical protein
LGIIASSKLGVVVPTSPVTTNLKQWYDASDATTITLNSGRVSAMTNKAVGFAYTVSQATAGNQPLLNTAAVNGKDTIQFTNARTDTLSNSTSFAPGQGATTMSFFLVVKIDDSTIQGGMYMTGRDAGAGGGYMPISLIDLSAAQKMDYQTGSGGNVLTATNVIANGTVLLHYVNQVGATSIEQKVITNGATDTTTRTSGLVALDVGGGGGGYTPGVGFNTRGGAASFQLCELLFYDATLSATDFTTNVDYIKNKWGIT